jgi:hypothetical protein
VYLTQMNPTGTGLLYSTYLGGSCNTLYGDLGFGVAVDSLGNAYIDGSTCSTDFPVYPSNAYQTALGGTYNAFVAKFALNSNPGITAIASPVANTSGWNNSPVTVSFTCIPGAAPIESCTPPTTVSIQGANQVVSGTVVDSANNTASASATVNLDTTPPVVSINSPANGAAVSTPYVVVTGSVSDALSGVANVLCNSVAATISGGSFSCTARLSAPSNTITVTAFDVAGNSVSASVTVTVNMATPTSLQITPSNSNLFVGNMQSFTAVDQTGTARPDAAWSVSDTTIANFVGGSPNTLTGIAAGQVTLTATVGSTSAQTTVTVVPASSLSAGTVLWSATPVPGFAAQQIVQAVPTANGPDIYSVEEDSNGDVLLRAFKHDGEQLWQTTNIPSGFGISTAIGDNSGGLLLEQQQTLGVTSLVDFNGVTGSQNWQFTPPSNGALISNPAVGFDGTVYVIEEDSFGYPAQDYDYNLYYVDSINGATGALTNQIQAPTSTYTSTGCTTYPPGYEVFGGRIGQPIIGSDGSLYVAVEYNTYAETNDPQSCDVTSTSVSETLSLLKATSGGAQYTQLAFQSTDNPPYNNEAYFPGTIIPDGEGGVLVSWVNDLAGGGTTISDVGPGGVVQSTFANLQPFEVSLVLGDSNTAFATDGTNIVAFGPTTLQQNWAYSSTDGFSDLFATNGGGLSLNDSQQGLIQLSSNGAPNSPVQAVVGTSYFGNSLYLGISTSVQGIYGPYVPWASSFWPFSSSGDKAGMNAPPPYDFELDWCANGVCSNFVDPISTLGSTTYDQNVSFSIRADDLPHNTTNLTNSQIQVIKMNAANALKLAFENYNVHVGVGRQGTNTVYVVGESVYGACGGTPPLSRNYSVAYYPNVVTEAQYALNATSGNPTAALLSGIGEGIGNDAAHELAHQLVNRFPNDLMDLDNQAPDVYNSGNCNGAWNYTGSQGGTPIHWDHTADQSLKSILGSKK